MNIEVNKQPFILDSNLAINEKIRNVASLNIFDIENKDKDTSIDHLSLFFHVICMNG